MKDDTVYIRHLLEAADKILRYVSGLSQSEFATNDLVFDATTREIMILGEAVVHLSDQFKNDHPEVPWHKITGMRNRLIHEYFGIDPDTVWETTSVDVPQLKQFLEKLI